MTHMIRLLGVALCLALALHALAARAENLPRPQDAVVLTVNGEISAMNAETAAEFDMQMLRDLGERRIETKTIWTEGMRTFTGVSLDALMGRLGADGMTIRATALNDYSIEIPMSDAVENGPMIAYESNGQPMSRRDKGPLWIIYPYDDNDDYRTEVIYSRSIWQLDRLEVVK